jgi:hypothetical protein
LGDIFKATCSRVAQEPIVSSTVGTEIILASAGPHDEIGPTISVDVGDTEVRAQDAIQTPFLGALYEDRTSRGPIDTGVTTRKLRPLIKRKVDNYV